jgi:L-threo-3-deoxy-hexylosonate aldolase
MPRLCVKVWKLWAEGKYEDSMLLQKVLSKGDWTLTKGGVPGTKQAIQLFYGYGGYARKPLRRLVPAEVKAISEKLTEIMKLERSL